MTHQRPKILAIDDNPANLLTLGAALANDFNIQTATSGGMGLALAAQNPPDLILLDIMMPEMDGYEVCQRIKEQPALKHVPVIFVTALNEFESEVKGLELGAADYITKPIKIEIARQRIRNLLDRERLRQEVQKQRDLLQSELIQRQQAQSVLRTLSVAVEQSPVTVVITDLDARIHYVNPCFTAITGYSAAEAIGQNPRFLQSGLTPRQTHLDMWDKLTHGVAWKGELLNKRKNGELYWEEAQIAPVKTPDGVVTHYVAIKSDVSERKLLESQVRNLAFYDPLTQLPNRRMLGDRLNQAIAAAKRNSLYCALMFLDLDNFKPLNDSRGHDIGDLLLHEVALRLQRCVREMDTVARFGGDEFVVLLRDLNISAGEAHKQAEGVAEKILLNLAEHYSLTIVREGQDDITVVHQCTASVGVVLFNSFEGTQKDLLNWSDKAMYEAKQKGRNRVCFHQITV